MNEDDIDEEKFESKPFFKQKKTLKQILKIQWGE